MRRGTPSRSSTSIARGNAASLDVVENAMIAGSRTARTNFRIGTLNISAIGRNTARKKTISAPYSVSTSSPRFLRTLEAAVTDGVRHRRADADRRVVHDDVRELEHRLGEQLAECTSGLPLLADHAEARCRR